MNRSDVHPAAWALCIGMLLAVVGCFVLTAFGIVIPDTLGYVTTGLVTATGAILAKTRRDPTEVEVVNPPSEPVPVEEN